MNQKRMNLFLTAILLVSAQLNAMNNNNNDNMFNCGYELRLNTVHGPLDNFIAALEHCMGQLHEQRQQNTVQSVQDILDLVLIVNGQCKEALDLFTYNEEIRNEFFLLQQNAGSAQKIERMSTLFTQISNRLQNLSTDFSLLDMTSSNGQENFENLKIALTQFLVYHNQINDILAGKQISIDDDFDSSAVEIEIMPNIENDEQIAQNINLEQNMELAPELRVKKQLVAVQRESQNIIQAKKIDLSTKRKFELVEEAEEKYNTLHKLRKFYGHEDDDEEKNKKVIEKIQIPPLDQNEFCFFADLPNEILVEIFKYLDQKDLNVIANSCRYLKQHVFVVQLQVLAEIKARGNEYPSGWLCKYFHECVVKLGSSMPITPHGAIWFSATFTNDYSIIGYDSERVQVLSGINDSYECVQDLGRIGLILSAVQLENGNVALVINNNMVPLELEDGHVILVQNPVEDRVTRILNFYSHDLSCDQIYMVCRLYKYSYHNEKIKLDVYDMQVFNSLPGYLKERYQDVIEADHRDNIIMIEEAN